MNINNVNNTTIQIAQDTKNTNINNDSAENPVLTSPATSQENNILGRTSELNFSANFISNQIANQLKELGESVSTDNGLSSDFANNSLDFVRNLK